MKKTYKKIIKTIILIIIMLAIGTTVLGYSPTDIVGNIPDSTMEDIDNLGSQIIGILQVIGIVVSVIVLIILGIKYMVGSIDQKAEYKKSMLPYVIGASILLSASTISSIIMHAIQF